VARHAHVKGPRIGALTALLAVSVALSALAVFGWSLSGGRLLSMSTPSMCPTVCVGSLVAVRPLEGAVHPGELVTFRPPGQSATFTHRVVKVEDNGSFTTKGDAEASPDPWVVPPSDVIGRVSFTLAGVGWWLRALPMVAAGTLVLLFARRAYRLRNRRTFERTFGVLIVAVPLIVLRPLIRGDLIENVADPHHRGWFKGLFVNTGLLPAQLTVTGGHRVPVLPPSRLTWLYGPKTTSSVFGVRQWAALPTWAWVVVGALVLSPIVGFLLYRATRPIERESVGVRVADAMALAPFAVPPLADTFERASFDAESVEEAVRDPGTVALPLERADPVLARAGAGRVGTVAAVPTRADAAPESTDLMAPAYYSTHDRWRHAGPEPRAVRRALRSEHAPRRNGARPPRPVPESSPPSRHQSRRRGQWRVRWPD
jgi:signal peptidase I